MPQSSDFPALADRSDPITAITAEAIAAGPSAINGTIGVLWMKTESGDVSER